MELVLTKHYELGPGQASSLICLPKARCAMGGRQCSGISMNWQSFFALAGPLRCACPTSARPAHPGFQTVSSPCGLLRRGRDHRASYGRILLPRHAAVGTPASGREPVPLRCLTARMGPGCPQVPETVSSHATCEAHHLKTRPRGPYSPPQPSAAGGSKRCSRAPTAARQSCSRASAQAQAPSPCPSSGPRQAATTSGKTRPPPSATLPSRSRQGRPKCW